MHHSSLLFAVLWLACAAPLTAAELEVFYVRHAEAGHNVSSEFKRAGIPTNEWPAYVGNERAFTPKGEQQAVDLAAALAGQRFDLIAASPTWRTRQTILPFLRASGQRAEIWPELAESAAFDLTADLLAPPPAGFPAEGRHRIKLAAEEEPFFVLGAPGVGSSELIVTNAASAAASALRVEARLRERFGGRPVRVLLVGHGNASKTLLRCWTRDPALHRPHLGNTRMWSGTLTLAGPFTLLRYNEDARTVVPSLPPAAR